MRILHVVDLSDHASLAPLACACAIRRGAARHTVWTLGAGAAPLAFPEPGRRFAARLGLARLSGATLRAPLRDASSRFDVITCWSPGALAAVHAALPRARPRVLGVFTGLPSAFPTLFESFSLRAPLDAAPILCFSNSAAQEWSRAGAIDVRIAPPIINALGAALPTRAEARARLKIAPHERVIALLADPPSIGDVRRFAYLSGLLSVGGTPTVGLVHARGAQMRRAARFLRECGRAWRFIASHAALADVLTASDVALCDVQVSPTHPLRTPLSAHGPRPTADALAAALAAAAGVPLIVPPVPLADELRAAGYQFITSADTTALALASSAFAALDGAFPSAGRAELPDGCDAIGTLHELWREMLNLPLPGFPLAPGAPIAELLPARIRLTDHLPHPSA